MRKDFDAQWSELAAEILSGMKEWRLQHPKASLKEIEGALDVRLGRLRVRMLEDAALASAAANLQTAAEEERAVCRQCGVRLASRGRQRRRLTTQYEETLTLTRSYGVCPTCGEGIFPPG